MKINNYLVLDERKNGMDFLIQSLTFLSQVEQNRFYLKWFVIAFHGALYSFMLLVLQSLDANQIYEKLPNHLTEKKDPKKKYDPFDGKLLDFKRAYNRFKNPKVMGGKPFVADNTQNKAMELLNYELRNQMLHFKPMISGYEPWFPAEVCLPLLDILNFCLVSEKIKLSESQVRTGLACIEGIKILLNKYSAEEPS